MTKIRKLPPTTSSRDFHLKREKSRNVCSTVEMKLKQNVNDGHLTFLIENQKEKQVQSFSNRAIESGGSKKEFFSDAKNDVWVA
jgi:hypothetical protein